MGRVRDDHSLEVSNDIDQALPAGYSGHTTDTYKVMLAKFNRSDAIELLGDFHAVFRTRTTMLKCPRYRLKLSVLVTTAFEL